MTPITQVGADNHCDGIVESITDTKTQYEIKMLWLGPEIYFKTLPADGMYYFVCFLF